MKNRTKIALFYGGKITRHLVMIREAAKKLKVDLKLVSYNLVSFETETGKVSLRGEDLNQFEVVFFRTTGKHWEEVDLVLKQLKKEVIVVDPLVKSGKPSYACKAWQMMKLKEVGIPVPKTVYGSLWYLYEVMTSQLSARHNFLGSGESAMQAQFRPKNVISPNCIGKNTPPPFSFPVILKGSGGDRGTRVFKANNLEELEKLIKELRKSETEEGKRYMLQEYIENEGDYRVLVLGERVLGVMKRYRRDKKDFRNNYSVGGEVEVSDLPEEIKEMAVKAAKVCGLMVAGVDVMPRINYQLSIKSTGFRKAQNYELSNNPKDWAILEVNKGPQFWGFMKATGIDVPMEIVKFLKSLSPQ
jgi:RimK family alpha-L-glutamate ligase